jgi:hypothetical protein
LHRKLTRLLLPGFLKTQLFALLDTGYFQFARGGSIQRANQQIEKRLFRTVTPETNRPLAGILASQQLQHNRVLAMRHLPSLADTIQSELSSNLAYGTEKSAHSQQFWMSRHFGCGDQ